MKKATATDSAGANDKAGPDAAKTPKPSGAVPSAAKPVDKTPDKPDSKPATKPETAKAADGKVEDAVVIAETPGKPVAGDSAPKGATTDGAKNDKPAASESAKPAATTPGKPATPGKTSDATGAETASSAKAETTPPGAAKPASASAGKSETVKPDAEKPSAGGGKPTGPVPAPVPAPPPERRSGFMPMVFGGVIAALLGAGALYYGNSQGWVVLGGDTTELDATIAAQADRIDSLQTALDTAESEITALKAAEPDLSPITTAQTALEGEQTALQEALSAANTEIAALKTQITANDTRLAEVETQPIPKAELPAEVVRAYETKLTELQTALDKRLAEMQTAIDTRLAAAETELDTKFSALETAQTNSLNALDTRLTGKLAEIEARQADASALEQTALDTARAAEARAALAGVTSALNTGAPFAEPLAELDAASDAGIPAALSDIAESGTPSLAMLQARFPEAARAALVASTRAASEEGTVGGVTAFFRTQLGARSLSPREGDDPDAILSRAEAAVGTGDLDTALAEIEKLPEAGQAPLADWTVDARTLKAAKAALGTLADTVNSNPRTP